MIRVRVQVDSARRRHEYFARRIARNRDRIARDKQAARAVSRYVLSENRRSVLTHRQVTSDSDGI